MFTYKDTAIATPNSDTPYSMLWLDLRAEPMVISVPAIDRQRYYSVQLCDGNTYNYGYIGTRATGSDAGDYMVVGPDWNGPTPSGIKKVFRSGTQFSLAIFRTQLFHPADIDNVKNVQAGYSAQPLSAYLKQPAPPAAPAIDFPRFNKELAKKNFFEYLDFALQFAPAAPNETEIRAKLASIGVGPGKTFSFKDLPLEQKLEIGLGLKQGQRKVERPSPSPAPSSMAGTSVGVPGDSALYNGDWLPAPPPPKPAFTATRRKRRCIRSHARTAPASRWMASKTTTPSPSPAGQLPPVNAFWSVTMYDGKSQLLIKNPINRYLINSPMLPGMKKNADGSLTLYIQNKSPGTDREPTGFPPPPARSIWSCAFTGRRKLRRRSCLPAKAHGSPLAWSEWRQGDKLADNEARRRTVLRRWCSQRPTK